MAPGSGDARLPELDGVRAASILLVLAGHMLPVGPAWMQLNAVSATSGMALFFCLSGFLIVRILDDRPEVFPFVLRRVARVAPLTALFAIVVAATVGMAPDAFFAVIFFYLNYQTTSIADHYSHLWSLSVEMHFYAAIAISVLLLGRRGLLIAPVGALVILGVKLTLGQPVGIATHIRVDEILTGGCLALIWLRRGEAAFAPVVGLVRASFWPALALLLVSAHPDAGALSYLRPYAAPLMVGALLFMGPGWRRSLACWRPLGYVAKISFALYVWHKLSYYGWLGEVGEGGKWEFYLLKRPISFALTFLAAHITTHTIERYCLNWARDRTRRRAEQTGF